MKKETKDSIELVELQFFVINVAGLIKIMIVDVTEIEN